MGLIGDYANHHQRRGRSSWRQLDAVVRRRTEAGREKYLAVIEKVFFPGRGLTDCLKYGRALAAVNMCGYDGQQHAHLGHGMIINPMGEVLGFFHGLPNLDRQRPMYAHAIVDVEERLWAPTAAPVGG